MVATELPILTDTNPDNGIQIESGMILTLFPKLMVETFVQPWNGWIYPKVPQLGSITLSTS